VDFDCDIAIAGGGPAGAAAAITLARAGLRVLLADSSPAQRCKIGEGLPPAARSLLRELGVLDQVLADGHLPCHGTLSAWGSEELQARDFVFGVQGSGLQLDRGRFDASLRRAAAQAGAVVVEQAQLRLADTAPLERFAPPPARWALGGADTCGSEQRPPHHSSSPTGESQGESDAQRGTSLLLRKNGKEQALRTRWLIDASGRAATLARPLGGIKVESAPLFAFHFRLASQRNSDHSGSTLVEAVPEGWWYSVRLPGGERLAALLGNPSTAGRRQWLDGKGLWAQLQQTRHLRELCATHDYSPASPVHGAEAGGAQLLPCHGPHWLAVGDAALSFDPLSSKGISNALYTGLRGASAVLAALHGDTDAPAAYAAHLADIYRHYVAQLAQVYAAETRWPDVPFWNSRD
jgi:flavin-dependent dehydrogenase